MFEQELRDQNFIYYKNNGDMDFNIDIYHKVGKTKAMKSIIQVLSLWGATYLKITEVYSFCKNKVMSLNIGFPIDFNYMLIKKYISELIW